MKRKAYSLKGFSLIELLVAMFIFGVIMTVASLIFANAFAGFRNTRNIQKDLENTHYIMSILAKELRTSTIVDPNGPSAAASSVQFYDHSQGRCLSYRIQGGAMQVASNAASDVAACNGMALSSYSSVSTGTVTGSFAVVPSLVSPKQVGKVTLTLRIQEGTSHSADIQTTVSLRDFGSEGSDL